MSLSLSVADLVVEHRPTPIGVDVRPRFGWTVRAAVGGVEQAAFRVVVSWRGAVGWDSGVRRDGRAREVEYDGPPLPSLERIRWEVTVGAVGADAAWDEATASSWFVTGITAAGVEKDRWTSAAWRSGRSGTEAAPLVRSEFHLDGPVTEAYLVVAAGGYARVELNGSLVEPATLSPGFTDYDRRVQYTVSDVRPQLRPGRNAVAVELGRGFYAMRRPNTWEWHRSPWTAERCVRMLLVARAPDGRTQVITTSDGRWVCTDGPTRSDDLYAGEDYDARHELAGCSEAGYPDDDWSVAGTVDGPRGRLEAQRQPPIEAAETLRPVLLSARPHADAGRRQVRRVYDVGRVIAGQVDITVTGEAGEVVTITHAEQLDADGRPDVSDPRGYYAGRFQTHALTLAGTELRWRPRFSYQGFRYVEVVSEHPTVLDAVVVHTRAATTGSFSCSDPLLARVHELTVRTMAINLHGIPTDTPTFEKNGWTADAMLGAEMMLLNLDTHELLAKWVDDVIDSRHGGQVPGVIAPLGGWSLDWTPAPPWHAALVLVPWTIFRHTGDTRVLRAAWTPIVEYLRVELNRSPGGIATTTLADWVSPETDAGGGNPDEDVRVAATAFLAMMCAVAAEIAEVLREPADEWRRAADGVAAAFRAEFLDAGIVRGRGDRGTRQSHQVLALAAGLIPPDRVADAVAALVAEIRRRGGRLHTGALSTKWLLPVLTRHGHADLAFELATRRSFPSWGFWIDNGATTLWEHWRPESRSRSHYFLGTIDDWLFAAVAGVTSTEPGWRRVRISPRLIDRLTHASAAIATPYGRLTVSWARSGDDVRLVADIPVGVTAEMELLGRSRTVASGRHEVVGTRDPSRRRPG